MPSVAVELGRYTAREGEQRSYDQGEILLGRSGVCDLRFRTSAVSRMHARIVLTGGNRWSVEDLKSRNGVFLNRQKISRAFVRVGDRVKLGAKGPELRILSLDPDPSMPAPPSF
jgi:pSer/pThr/pTyr-binding forkhead associated (FHA) protein